MIYIELFFAFFKVGLFAFGGGYASLPLIQNEVVTLNHWLSMGEYSDIVTISQMTPGPIAINSATFVGTKIAGVPGAIIATFGCIMPSIIIVMLLAYFFYKYKKLSIIDGTLKALRPGVVALIGSAAVSLMIMAFFGGLSYISLPDFDIVGVILFAAALFVLRKWKASPMLVMAGSGIIGTAIYLIIGK